MPAVSAHIVDPSSPSISPRTTLPSSPLTTTKPFSLSPSLLTPSPDDDKTQRFPYANLLVGHAEEANPRHRRAMEDALTISTIPCSNGVFLAVYDGHGGSSASTLASLTLHEDFSDALTDHADPERAFQSAYATCDSTLRTNRAFCVGTTALTIYIHPHATALTVANVGDTRCVLGTFTGTASRISVDHTPKDREEAVRVSNAGGFICSGRVNGALAVTRALGDHCMKSVVISDPYLTTMSLHSDHRFVILACDGLWDVIDDHSAVRFVNHLLDNTVSTSPAQIARMLVRHALEKGTTDNISVVIALFHRNS